MVTAVSNEVFVVHIPSLPCFFITIEIIKIISSFHPYISFLCFCCLVNLKLPFPPKFNFQNCIDFRRIDLVECGECSFAERVDECTYLEFFHIGV